MNAEKHTDTHPHARTQDFPSPRRATTQRSKGPRTRKGVMYGTVVAFLELAQSSNHDGGDHQRLLRLPPYFDMHRAA